MADGPTEVGRGVSALLAAKYRGDEAEAERLLGEAPALDIFEAAVLGRRARVEELVTGAPELARSWSTDGFTALHLAVFFGHPEIARDLLGAGADPGAVSRNTLQVQPLHSAVAAPDLQASRLLLEAGADPDAVQQDGFTPLDAAIQNRDEAIEAL